MHPIPPSLTFELAYAVQEQLFKQSSSHSFNPMALFTSATSVLGIFMFSSFKNPSPLLHTSVSFLQHPWLQSRLDFGLNPGMHLQSNFPGVFPVLSMKRIPDVPLTGLSLLATQAAVSSSNFWNHIPTYRLPEVEFPGVKKPRASTYSSNE
nr:hypothetical protein CR513_16898 [Ipomoea batatas]